MRLDKFLALSGLIRRRTKAQEACDRGYVALDGRPTKPGRTVRVGQEVALRQGDRLTRYRIRELPSRPVARAAQDQCVELLDVQTIEPLEE